MYEIVQRHGHYEVLCAGKFIESADTYHEAERAVVEAEHGKENYGGRL